MLYFIISQQCLEKLLQTQDITLDELQQRGEVMHFGPQPVQDLPSDSRPVSASEHSPTEGLPTRQPLPTITLSDHTSSSIGTTEIGRIAEATIARVQSSNGRQSPAEELPIRQPLPTITLSDHASPSIDSIEIARQVEATIANAKSFDGSQCERLKLMKQLEFLHLRLKEPADPLNREVKFLTITAAIDMMIQVRGLEKIPKQGDITAKKLGKLIGVERSVLVRLMRLLIGSGLVALTGEDTYAHTVNSLELLYKVKKAFLDLHTPLGYRKTRSCEDLTDPFKNPFSCTYGCEARALSFYEVMWENFPTTRHKMLGKAMYQQDRDIPVLGMFPFASVKDQVIAEPDRPFIVDIGGGLGYSLIAIAEETSNAFGTASKMILQDKWAVLQRIYKERLPSCCELMCHNFYKPQPVKNAHIYYLRRILHLFQDDTCISILRAIASAMTPSSRLLIAEMIIQTPPVVGGDMMPYCLDMVMLVLGGKERNLKEFKDLFHQAGLKLVDRWNGEGGLPTGQAVLEVRLQQAE